MQSYRRIQTYLCRGFNEFEIFLLNSVILKGNFDNYADNSFNSLFNILWRKIST